MVYTILSNQNNNYMEDHPISQAKMCNPKYADSWRTLINFDICFPLLFILYLKSLSRHFLPCYRNNACSRISPRFLKSVSQIFVAGGWQPCIQSLKRLTQPHCATSVRISFTSRHCFEKLIDQNDLPCTLHKEKKNTDVDGGVFMSTAHVYFRFIQQYGGPDGDYFCLYKYYNYQLLRKMTRYLPHQIRPALDSLKPIFLDLMFSFLFISGFRGHHG